jgi:cytidine deaminase
VLTDWELALVKHAAAVMASTKEDGNYTVAAAAYDSVGNVFTGVDVFRFTGGPCAGSVVMGQAVVFSDAQLP